MAIDPTDPRFELPPDNPLGGTEWYQALPQPTRARIGLHDVTNGMKVGLQFESVLKRGLRPRRGDSGSISVFGTIRARHPWQRSERCDDVRLPLRLHGPHRQRRRAGYRSTHHDGHCFGWSFGEATSACAQWPERPTATREHAAVDTVPPAALFRIWDRLRHIVAVSAHGCGSISI